MRPPSPEPTEPAGLTRQELVRRGLAAGVAISAAGVLPGVAVATHAPLPAPDLPRGFDRTFSSRSVKTGDLRQHVVIGGDGPPLLLVHGWPENWYAWRLVMPALACNFRVIAVDQRGMGRSGKPTAGYDAAQLANDQIALMDALGHRRFAVVGHDTGMVIAYALAADHPSRVARLVVIDAPLPGVAPSAPLLVPPALNDRLYHLSFNQLATVNEQLVRGREDIFFGFEFATFAAKPLPSSATEYYISGFASSREALSASFGFYRALWTTTGQNAQRMTRRLTLPILAIGGAQSLGEGPANAMRLTADDVESVVVPDCGHWVAEEAPDPLLASLTAFLAPYRATGR